MKLIPEQYADKLIEQYYALIPRFGNFKKNWKIAIEMSLIDVQNTIDSYTELIDDNSSWEGYKEKAISKLEYYQEVKQILKSKL